MNFNEMELNLVRVRQEEFRNGLRSPKFKKFL